MKAVACTTAAAVTAAAALIVISVPAVRGFGRCCVVLGFGGGIRHNNSCNSKNFAGSMAAFRYASQGRLEVVSSRRDPIRGQSQLLPLLPGPLVQMVHFSGSGTNTRPNNNNNNSLGRSMTTRLFSSGSSISSGFEKAGEVDDDQLSISSEGAWEETVEGEADDYEVQEAGFGDDDDDIVAEEANDDEESLFEYNDNKNNVLYNELLKWSKQLSNTMDALSRKKKSLSNELKKAETVEDTKHRAQLLTSNMYLFTTQPGARKAMVQDWENDGKEVELILDDAYDSASAEADALFQQIRKLKRGSAVVKNLLEETDDALNMLQEMELDLKNVAVTTTTASEASNHDTLAPSSGSSIDETMLRLIQDRLIRTCRKTGFIPPKDYDDDKKTDMGSRAASSSSSNTVHGGRNQNKPALGTPASNIRKLMSPGGCIVYVGRNRRGNEHLTFHIARGDDIWMHARGCPGAHVLIQQRRGSPRVTDACLQFAADLAILFSDARLEKSFAVTSAEPKHLQKPRGAPLGAVKLREEWNVYMGYPDQVAATVSAETVSNDNNNNNNNDSYYRFRDKAKHRKKTNEAASAKRKAKIQEKKKRKNSS